MGIYLKSSNTVSKIVDCSHYISDNWVQLATAGATKSQTVYKTVPSLGKFKLIMLYCNYSSGYYTNPVLVTLQLFKDMNWLVSDRRDNSNNYTVLCHYVSDTKVQFVTENSDAALYGIY